MRAPNATVPETYVFKQSPQPGTKVNKGNQVTIYASSGKPKTTVPSVLGVSSTDAVGRLADAKLKAKVIQVTSDKQTGTVIGQTPTAGASVDQGSLVTLHVSNGKPVEYNANQTLGVRTQVQYTLTTSHLLAADAKVQLLVPMIRSTRRVEFSFRDVRLP